jgi:hypothetical protein
LLNIITLTVITDTVEIHDKNNQCPRHPSINLSTLSGFYGENVSDWGLLVSPLCLHMDSNVSVADVATVFRVEAVGKTPKTMI